MTLMKMVIVQRKIIVKMNKKINQSQVMKMKTIVLIVWWMKQLIKNRKLNFKIKN